MKILVGMSGGVDSSVAAKMLKDAGHDVTGIMMSVWDGEPAKASKKHACYGPDEAEDVEDARWICGDIGIPFHLFDCSKVYRNVVVENFRSEYLSARTPNPCVRCNQRLKFGALLEAAERAGFTYDFFATGHYARIEKDELSGRFSLLKGTDRFKDQSYFLYRLSQAQLSKTLFPLGDKTKEEVRSLARKFGLAVSEKEESHDFYSGDYRELLGVKDTGGDIVLANGTVVGRHRGLWNYTPGQRRGIGVSSKEPLYVVKLDAASNSVVVGSRNQAKALAFTIYDMTWINEENIENIKDLKVRLRSSAKEISCKVTTLSADEKRIDLDEETGFAAPGQSAVFYTGDYLLGGGVVKNIVPGDQK